MAESFSITHDSTKFSPDSRWATAISSSNAYVLDTQTGSAIGEPLRHASSVPLPSSVRIAGSF